MAGTINYVELVGSIYEAALEPATLNAALEQLACAARARISTVILRSPDRRKAISAAAGLDPDAVDAYNLHFSRLDRLVPQHSAPPIAFASAAVDRLWPGFHRSEFFNEWAKPNQSAEIALVTVGAERSVSSTIVLAGGSRDALGTSAQLGLLASVTPHFNRMMALRERLEIVGQTNLRLLEAFEHLPYGIIVIDASGRPMHVTAEAEQMMRKAGALRIGRGRVQASDPDLNLALRRMISRMLGLERNEEGGQFESLSVNVRSGPYPLFVHGIPLGQGNAHARFGSHCAGLLLIVDPNRRREVDLELLRRSFGLTKAEAVVALGVMRGEDLRSLSSGLAVSISTLRSHLLKIFAKTGTARQAELVRMLVSLSR